MNEPTITCPSCSEEIKLTESLAAPLIAATRKEYEDRLAAKEQAVAEKEETLATERSALKKAREDLDLEVAEKLKAERADIAAAEAKKAKLAASADLEAKSRELAELQGLLTERNEKLATAQKAEAEFRRKERQLEDAKRELELTVEAKVTAGLEEVRLKARQEAEDGLKLKVSEKEQQIASMQRQIEDLKRKAEQGSQQMQGEVLELELEALLRSRFPLDGIEPVAKGEFGGDVLQRVVSPAGSSSGAILWESKRTKNWSDGWLAKLRGDQRAAGAEFAILVTVALPKDITSFGQLDGVWVTEPRFAEPLAIVLRQTLIEVNGARQVQQGQATKMELVYHYLTGPKFRHRVEAIVEKFSDMQDDLAKERKATQRLWAKRDAQIQAVIESTVGMYGDLQGIAGQAMQEIEGLTIPMIESDGDPSED